MQTDALDTQGFVRADYVNAQHFSEVLLLSEHFSEMLQLSDPFMNM